MRKNRGKQNTGKENNSRKTRTAGIVLGVLMAGISVTPAFAAGWAEENNIWIYLDKENRRLTDCWQRYEGRYYYLDQNGEMAVDRIVEYDGKKYYVDPTGARVSNSWISVPNEDAQWDNGGQGASHIDTIWYYFGPTGKAYDDAKKLIDGKYYLFDEDGRMLSGWQTYGDDEDIYYLGAQDEGWIHTGWQSLTPDDTSGGGGYDMEEWFYFKPASGKACRETRRKINDRYYTFDENGVMMDKWIVGAPDTSQDSSSHYQEEEGSQDVGWVYAYGPEDVDESGDKYWFYLDSKGVPFNEHGKDAYQMGFAIKREDDAWLSSSVIYTSVAAKVIKNKTYLFDKDGKMLTGLYYLDDVKRKGGSDLGKFNTGNGYYAGAYYYFNNKEGAREGQMMTGKQTVEDEEWDDKWYYHFKNSGEAYTNIIVDGRMYGHDGAQLRAEDDRYETVYIQAGVVIREKGSSRTHTDCDMLVDSSGRVKKSGTVRYDGIKYTIKDYEIIEQEDID